MNIASYKKRLKFLVPIVIFLLLLQLYSRLYAITLIKILYLTALCSAFYFLVLPPLLSLFHFKTETPIWFHMYKRLPKKQHKKVARDNIFLGLFFITAGVLFILQPYELKKYGEGGIMLAFIFFFLGILLFFTASMHISSKSLDYVEKNPQTVSEILISFFVVFIILILVYMVTVLMKVL
jgi:hypothetical protein